MQLGPEIDDDCILKRILMEKKQKEDKLLVVEKCSKKASFAMLTFTFHFDFARMPIVRARRMVSQDARLPRTAKQERVGGCAAFRVFDNKIDYIRKSSHPPHSTYPTLQKA